MTKRSKGLWLEQERSLLLSSSAVQQFKGKWAGPQGYLGPKLAIWFCPYHWFPATEEGKKSRAWVCHFCLHPIGQNLVMLHTIFNRGWEMRSPAKQPGTPWKAEVRGGCYYWKSDGWRQVSSLHDNSNPDSQAGTWYSVHSFNRLYFPQGLQSTFYTNEL